MTSKIGDVHLDTDGATREMLQSYGEGMAVWQRGVNWWLGDIAIAAKRLLGDEDYMQVFPEWMSPGLVSRCEAVARAYPKDSRNLLATWTIHMQHANRPDRVELVQAHVDAGHTSDEAKAKPTSNRWLLAFDCNYFVHDFWFSGSGVESAMQVAGWIQRTVDRLKEKGVTDAACCFDGRNNFRKALTANWEDKYKDRPQKEPELVKQLELCEKLLAGHGFTCAKVDGMEADDVMASYAAQFDGRVSLVTPDKDLRQCLSDSCNILLSIDWDEETGHQYDWLSAKRHRDDTGLTPEQWIEFQTLMGDPVDGIRGAVGIGEKGAKELVLQFGSASAAIQAAKDGHPDITPHKRDGLIEFEPKLEVTRQLVTMRTDCPLPSNTKV